MLPAARFSLPDRRVDTTDLYRYNLLSIHHPNVLQYRQFLITSFESAISQIGIMRQQERSKAFVVLDSQSGSNPKG